MRINSVLVSVALLAAAGARTTAMAEAIRCLTGNARPAAGVAGTYTILKAGLSIPGFPASDTPEETERPFASGRLTDGNPDTLFEWPDREFGSLGRDIEVDLRIEVMEWLDQSAAGPADFHIGWFLYGARPAWLGATASGERCIVYAAEWINPYPDKEIANIDLVLPSSSMAKGAVLFAITGVVGLQRAP